MRFDSYIGIDYSGAATAESRSASIQVYLSRQQCEAKIVPAPGQISQSPARANIVPDRQRLSIDESTVRKKQRIIHWNRRELAEWLKTTLAANHQCIVGMDHGFSFPLSYFQRYGLSTWDQFLRDFSQHWPTDQSHTRVESFRSGNARIGHNSEFRITETWTSSAKSVFQFDVNGSVAKSTHAGLPFLWQLRQSLPKVHFWPFDGWNVPPGKSVIAEIYPSLFRNRYPRSDRSADQQDAYAVSRWLMEMDAAHAMDRYFMPPLSESQQIRAKNEGWILGVT